MARLISIILFALTNLICFADYSDRGRPSDFQEPHDGPLTYIFMGIAALVVLAFIGYWIYDKITSHKEQISDALGTIFAGLLIFGGMLLFGTCAGTLMESIAPKSQTEQVNSDANTTSPSEPKPNNIQNSNQYTKPQYTKPQYTKPQYTPTLHYRTVEYYENCYICNGTGHVLCPQCKGTGSYRKTCSRCNGSGGHNRFPCIYCNGNGYTEDNVFGSGRHSCINCGGSGYVDQSCQWCGGSGYESETCDIYASMGQGRHYVTCSTCNGNGRVRRTRQESYYE